MPIPLPIHPAPAGVVAPATHPHFLGYHGTSAATGASLQSAGATPADMGDGEMGLGIYVTESSTNAGMYAWRKQGGPGGVVLMVFCNPLLGRLHGEWCDASAYAAGLGGKPVIPPGLMGFPFLRDQNNPIDLKINPGFIGHLAFLQ